MILLLLSQTYCDNSKFMFKEKKFPTFFFYIHYLSHYLRIYTQNVWLHFSNWGSRTPNNKSITLDIFFMGFLCICIISKQFRMYMKLERSKVIHHSTTICLQAFRFYLLFFCQNGFGLHNHLPSFRERMKCVRSAFC